MVYLLEQILRTSDISRGERGWGRNDKKYNWSCNSYSELIGTERSAIAYATGVPVAHPSPAHALRDCGTFTGMVIIGI